MLWVHAVLLAEINEVILMRTHNIHFHDKIRKVS